ncbi:hypothetical protein SCORR_v1c10260 (plasmid) [Spiroplasma corruscae]|uniref:Uncharacterized protein n=1 Tax=Spiroplasma corruscae TaxID=216934 RepID=A0A222EQI7_9MOLU|nr:hypothetical protein [Spiroplasma corruscae]ASP28798.1 hypothetical protein SCORR_v1c10260 [Spiroplasma corruscae]
MLFELFSAFIMYKIVVKTGKFVGKSFKSKRRSKYVDNNQEFSAEIYKNKNPEVLDPSGFELSEPQLKFKSEKDLMNYVNNHIKKNNINDVKNIIKTDNNNSESIEKFNNIKATLYKKESEFINNYINQKNMKIIKNKNIFDEDINKSDLKAKLVYGLDEEINKDIEFNTTYIKEINKKIKSINKKSKVKVKPKKFNVSKNITQLVKTNPILKNGLLQKEINFKLAKLNILEEQNTYSKTKIDPKFKKQKIYPSDEEKFEFVINNKKKKFISSIKIKNRNDEIINKISDYIDSNWENLKNNKEIINIEKIILDNKIVKNVDNDEKYGSLSINKDNKYKQIVKSDKVFASKKLGK